MNEQKAAWLATELMGMVRIPKNRPWIDGDDTWWIKDGRFIAPVKDWNPFADIAQAKEVQAAMFDRGHDTGTDAKQCSPKWFAYFGDDYATADTEAAAICLAAGRAMGWPFDD